MLKTNAEAWRISTVIIVIILFMSLCISSDNSNSNASNDNTASNQLNILYLSKSMYLLPTPPETDELNKTELTSAKSLIFGHNIRDRKFNKDLAPELELWLDTHGKSGLVLTFELGFQAWEDETLVKGKFFKILFENYTTTGAKAGENAKVSYAGIEGEPFDIKYGSDNWCAIYFKVNLTGNISGTGVEIYCGAEGKISKIKIPYDQTLSAYIHGEDSDGDSTPGFQGGFIIIILGALTVIYKVFLKPPIKIKNGFYIPFSNLPF